ncbi:MAG: type II toxin-antitoxin system VapC family toxin [Micromonosporaceae bacterium]
MTAVVDASIVITLLANSTPDELLRRRFSGMRMVHAPHLIDAEVASGLRGLLLGRKITIDRVAQILEIYRKLPLVRHPMTPSLPRVMQLRDNFTAYDACYVAVAEATRLPLLTRDAKFERAVGHRAHIQVHP